MMIALLFGALFTVSCDRGEQNVPDPDPDPQPTPQKPLIEVTAGEATETTFTFDITTNQAGEYAYYFNDVHDTSVRPNITDWFNENSGVIEQSATVTIEGLNAGISYELYVVVRATESALLSDVKKVEFTTAQSSEAGPISLLSVTHDSYSFKVDLDGYYLYYGVSETMLNAMGATPEQWVETFGYLGSGVNVYEFIDGEYHSDLDVEPARVISNSKHYIMVVECDSKKNITGSTTYVVTFETPAKPAAEGGVEITLSNVTSTSVDIQATPADSITDYHILVQPKANIEAIIAEYGESTLISLMKTGYSAWHLTGNHSATWGNLVPNTEYCVCLCAIDKSSGETFSYDLTFTTEQSSGVVAELNVELVENSDKPYEKIDIKVSAKNATYIKYAFTDSAAIEEQRKNGHDDAFIAKNFGAEFTAEQLEQALNGGLTITREDLWPEASYTVIVYAHTAEKIESVKAVSLTLPKQPAAARVESQLFESLLGEWTLSYDYIDVQGNMQHMSNKVVTIAQGVDSKTTADYRDLNRLVITGWQFQPSDIPFFGPQTLMESFWGWAGDYSALAYRDYGPKVFLEIGEGDTITMPTSKSVYLYHWDDAGNLLQFFGCDYDDLSIAPVSFPVELSADGNTLTIKPYADTEGKFWQGCIYYPAVFRGNEAWSVATSNITLTRK